MNKFGAGTKEHAALLELKKSFDELVPPAEQASDQPPVPPTLVVGVQPRAQGVPDFSLDGGRQPLDLARMVDLAAVPDDEFKDQRPAVLAPRAKVTVHRT